MKSKSRSEKLHDMSISSKTDNLDAAEQYEKDAAKRLRIAAKEIAKQRDEFIRKYADEDGTLTFSEATKLFSKAEQENWYVGLDEWISLARESARTGKYDDYLNLEYYNSQIGRLTAYQKQLELVMAQVAGNETMQLEKALELQYEEAYYKSVYNVQNGQRRYTEDFTQIDTEMLKKVINKPWAGSDFSERIWNNYTNKLPEMLTNSMSRAIATGGTSADIAREMELVLKGFSKYEVHRLVTTEFGHLQEKGTLEGYIESGVKEYEWISALENRTCEICGKLDGKIFPVKLAKVGINYPLIHPLCRCTTGPYFKDLKMDEDTGVRAAIDPETNEEVEIPEMSFSKWKNWVAERQDKKSMILEFKRMQLAKVDGLPSLEKYLKLKETAPHVADKFVKQYEKQLKSDDQLFGKNRVKTGSNGNDSTGKNGIIDIEIDSWTPCLKRVSDDKIVQTIAKDMTVKNIPSDRFKFDFNDDLKKGYTVKGLYADNKLQGMVSYELQPENIAVFVHHAERISGKKEYGGVGAHLFAEAVSESFNQGFDGVVFFNTKNQKLNDYYKKTLGAKNVTGFRMWIDETEAKKLYDYYNKGK